MRRALLTAGASTGTPVTVGNTGTFATTNGAGLTQRTLVNTSDPASASSTVVTVSMYVVTGGTFYVHTGSLVSTTYTIRAVSSAVFRAAGLNTFSESLAVLTGDYIGVTSLDGGVLGVELSAAGETVGVNNLAATPTVGAALTLPSTASVRLAILGTNP